MPRRRHRAAARRPSARCATPTAPAEAPAAIRERLATCRATRPSARSAATCAHPEPCPRSSSTATCRPAAARLLGRLTDGADRGAARICLAPSAAHGAAAASPSPPPAATAAACWRRSATSTCCSSPPPSPPGGAARGRVHALFPVGSRPEGRPRHPLGRRLPGRGQRRRHHAHLPAGRPAARRRRRAVRRLPERFRGACKAAGAAGYFDAKQAERAVRHRRYGDSPFVVEPNIKEGRGGLRDLQTLYWLARYVFGTTTMTELAEPAALPAASSPRPKRASPSAPGTSCGRCVSIFITSPAAPRSA